MSDVSSVKVSSMKSMFEKPKKSEQDDAPAPPRRRQLRTGDWANAQGGNQKVVKEGYFEERGGVVRPPTAGTKERPSYSLSADFLKSRAAMFESAPPKQYVPKNTVNVKQADTPKDVVNSKPTESDLNYALPTSLKDTKKIFENGSSDKKEPAAASEPEETAQDEDEETQEPVPDEQDVEQEPEVTTEEPEQEEEEPAQEVPQQEEEEPEQEEPEQVEEPEQQEEEPVAEEQIADDETQPEDEVQEAEPEAEEQQEAAVEPDAESYPEEVTQEPEQADTTEDTPAAEEDTETQEPVQVGDTEYLE